MPGDVIRDALFKVGAPQDTVRVSVSNAKLNVVLSVRIMQHPQLTYADLLSLFHMEADGGQTIIYVNSRTEAEQIQDFLCKHRPSHMPAEAFKFYHRNIGPRRKQYIQEGLWTGQIRCVIATDALGMVCCLLGGFEQY